LIKLAPYTMDLCAHIAVHLNDEQASDPGPAKKDHTGSSVYNDLIEWENTTNSKSFVITRDDRAAGVISLSKIDIARKEASIGYWVFSEYRNQGVATMAFDALIQMARDKGIETVKAKILKDNAGSRRIWERYEHRSEAGDTMSEYHMSIVLPPPH
jgi:RimJ/RimL family protein N-acetyltransferase